MLTLPGSRLIVAGGVNVIEQTSELPPRAHAGELAELGRGEDPAQVWIHRSALERLGLPPSLRVEHGGTDDTPELLARRGISHPFVDRALAAGYRVAPAGLAPWVVVHTPAGVRVDLAVPAWDDAGGLERLTAAELERALWIYRATVGTVYRRSPGTSGKDLLRRLRRRGFGPSAPAPPSVDGALETDLRWIGTADGGRAWVHAYDANARYLASCSSVELGIGAPAHLLPSHGPTLGFDPRLPGYWRAEILPAPDLLTHCALDGPHKRRPPWYTTPTIELARDLGLLGHVAEAWIWEEHGRLLGSFYQRLRDARATTRRYALSIDREVSNAGDAAAVLVKRTYAHTIGGFAGHWRNPGDELYRPDWRHAIIARARVNLYRRIRRLPPSSAPFAVDVDAVWIATDEPDPAIAGEALGIGETPGTFRWIGSAPMRHLEPRLAGHTGAGWPWAPLRELVA